MAEWLEILVSSILIIGGFFVFIGSFGLLKLPDFFTRLHGPTKATTLGIGAVLIASMIITTVRDGQLSIHELVISVFLLITAPISAHMLAKAALHRQVPMLERTHKRELTRKMSRQKAPDAKSEHEELAE